MSRSCGFELQIVSPKLSRLEILSLLLKNGWSPIYYGNISNLPIGDSGDYNWQSQGKEKWDEVRAIIEQKEKLNEPLGNKMRRSNLKLKNPLRFRVFATLR